MWEECKLSEYEDYVERNYAGFRLEVRHIHGKYHWQAKKRQSYWGAEDTLEFAKKAAQDAAWKAPCF